jgi:hypothetical protein
MGDRTTGQVPDSDGEGIGEEGSPRPGNGRVGISLRGIQLVVRTLADAPLHQTARRYPHVINKLALAWHRDEAFDAVIDELLFTQRPNRQGFPPGVLRELVDLRSLHERRIGKAALASDPAGFVTDMDSLRRRLMYVRPPKD